MQTAAVQVPLAHSRSTVLTTPRAALLQGEAARAAPTGGRDVWEVSATDVAHSAACAAAAQEAYLCTSGARAGIFGPPAPPQPTHAYSAGYQVQMLLDGICANPPDVYSVARLLAYVHGQKLTVADKGSRGENLLDIAKQLIRQKPHTYGMARETAVAEMRIRLVTRALRALTEAQRGVIIWGTVDDLWKQMNMQKRLFRRRFARNPASEFKLHEAASLLASMPNTQTRMDRAGRKVLDLVLLAAAIASTFLPFLALGPARNAVGNAATSFGNASGATGMVAFDLAADLISRKPRPAPWHDLYRALRARFEEFKQARKQNSSEACSLEAAFARDLAAYHPKRKLLWRTWGFEWPRSRRIFMLGVLDLTDRFIRRAHDIEHVALLVPTLYKMLKSHKAAWHERAVEVALTLEDHLPRLGAHLPHVKVSQAFMACQSLVTEALTAPGYDDARQRWNSRAELGNVLQAAGHNGGLH